MAKLIIKLIHQVAELAAADLSEQISLVGTEASGTGNVKLQLNGALTIGTLDGANVEILEEVGSDNIFIFGLTAAQVSQLRASYNPWEIYHHDEEVRRALEMIERDFFNLLEPGIFKPIIQALLDGGDRYMLLADLRSYIQSPEHVDAVYSSRDDWTAKRS
jgi:glycogen phosphorylase